MGGSCLVSFERSISSKGEIPCPALRWPGRRREVDGEDGPMAGVCLVEALKVGLCGRRESAESLRGRDLYGLTYEVLPALWQSFALNLCRLSVWGIRGTAENSFQWLGFGSYSEFLGDGIHHTGLAQAAAGWVRLNADRSMRGRCLARTSRGGHLRRLLLREGGGGRRSRRRGRGARVLDS